MVSAPSPFIVLSLPRSRSAWLAHFLAYGGARVGHDIATECSSVADFRARLAPLDGTCETGAVLGWRLIRAELPDAKLVIIQRDPMEVAASLGKFGIRPDVEELVLRRVMLDQVAALPGVQSLPVEALDDPLVCKQLFESLLDAAFDWQWWTRFNQLNIQVDMPKRLVRLAQNHEKLEAFKREVHARSTEVIQCVN